MAARRLECGARRDINAMAGDVELERQAVHFLREQAGPGIFGAGRGIDLHEVFDADAHVRADSDNARREIGRKRAAERLHVALARLSGHSGIADDAGFAAAARKLGRATSVVSYAIANLEAQLGLSLFQRAGSRRPELTEAGRAILGDARGIAIALDGLLAKARGLTEGLEAEVALVVDVMLPPSRLVKALDAFRRRFPTVALRLEVEALGAVTERVLAGQAAFGISGPLELESDLLVRKAAGARFLVMAATPAAPRSLIRISSAPVAKVRDAMRMGTSLSCIAGPFSGGLSPKAPATGCQGSLSLRYRPSVTAPSSPTSWASAAGSTAATR